LIPSTLLLPLLRFSPFIAIPSSQFLFFCLLLLLLFIFRHSHPSNMLFFHLAVDVRRDFLSGVNWCNGCFLTSPFLKKPRSFFPPPPFTYSEQKFLLPVFATFLHIRPFPHLILVGSLLGLLKLFQHVVLSSIRYHPVLVALIYLSFDSSSMSQRLLAISFENSGLNLLL